MSPDQIVLVRASFHLLDQVKGQASGMFYGRLFSIAPELRSLFARTDMLQQSGKLWAMLGRIVEMLDQPQHLMPAAEKLAREHVAFGVEPEHYPPVGAALLWTLDQAMGAAWSDETKEAWEAAYLGLSQVMIRAAYLGGTTETSHTQGD
ncbi:globin family protein [Frigidibacter sp. MR17.24]|uniref:globin family protein n=1 Tax=Frigidibacter sp. MR17.24 TaxID=3127345 RepID=UPI003012ED1A